MRINKDDIPYWESIISDLSTTKDQIIFAEQVITSLNIEYEYGRKYALIEADLDEKYITSNGKSEGEKEIRERKTKAREKELEMVCEKIKLQKLFLIQHWKESKN